jgi:hypothetical protein
MLTDPASKAPLTARPLHLIVPIFFCVSVLFVSPFGQLDLFPVLMGPFSSNCAFRPLFLLTLPITLSVLSSPYVPVVPMVDTL